MFVKSRDGSVLESESFQQFDLTRHGCEHCRFGQQLDELTRRVRVGCDSAAGTVGGSPSRTVHDDGSDCDVEGELLPPWANDTD